MTVIASPVSPETIRDLLYEVNSPDTVLGVGGGDDYGDCSSILIDGLNYTDRYTVSDNLRTYTGEEAIHVHDTGQLVWQSFYRGTLGPSVDVDLFLDLYLKHIVPHRPQHFPLRGPEYMDLSAVGEDWAGAEYFVRSLTGPRRLSVAEFMVMETIEVDAGGKMLFVASHMGGMISRGINTDG